MKKVLGTALALTLIGGFWAAAGAQPAQTMRPMITGGTQELGIAGRFDFEDQEGSFAMDLTATYGIFTMDNFLIGGKAGFVRRGLGAPADGTFEQLTLGAFGEIHFPINGMTVPYLGIDLDWRYTDRPVAGSDNSAVATPKVGVKWFMRDYFAIDTSMFYAVATDDIFIRDRSAKDTDWGARVGLRVFFR
jgi:hypothetical protein